MLSTNLLVAGSEPNFVGLINASGGTYVGTYPSNYSLSAVVNAYSGPTTDYTPDKTIYGFATDHEKVIAVGGPMYPADYPNPRSMVCFEQKRPWVDPTWSSFSVSLGSNFQPSGTTGGGARAIGWNGTYWLMGGRSVSGTSELWRSYDSSNWEPVSNISFGNGVTKIVWNGRAWVVIGDSDDHKTMYVNILDDGYTWIQPDGSTFLQKCTDVAWSGARWIAVGGSNIITSERPDAQQWSWVRGEFPSEDFKSVTWTGEKWIVVGNSVYQSTNGFNWTSIAEVPGSNFTSVQSTISYPNIVGTTDIRYSSPGNIDANCMILGHQDAQYGPVLYSLLSDNKEPLWKSSPLFRDVSSTVYDAYRLSGDTFLFAGDLQHSGQARSALYTVQTTLTSSGSAVVTPVSIDMSTCYRVVANPSGVFLAVGETLSSFNNLFRSTNGTTWAAISSQFTRIRDVAWNGSTWVAVGDGPSAIATSSNGTDWTYQDSELTSGYCVAWNGRNWIAAGTGSSKVVMSISGDFWNSIDDGLPSTVSAVRTIAASLSTWVIGVETNTSYADTLYYTWYFDLPSTWRAGGYKGRYDLSTGNYESKSVFEGIVRSVRWTGNEYIACGDEPFTIAKSSNGITWSTEKFTYGRTSTPAMDKAYSVWTSNQTILPPNTGFYANVLGELVMYTNSTLSDVITRVSDGNTYVTRMNSNGEVLVPIYTAFNTNLVNFNTYISEINSISIERFSNRYMINPFQSNIERSIPFVYTLYTDIVSNSNVLLTISGSNQTILRTASDEIQPYITSVETYIIDGSNYIQSISGNVNWKDVPTVSQPSVPSMLTSSFLSAQSNIKLINVFADNVSLYEKSILNAIGDLNLVYNYYVSQNIRLLEYETHMDSLILSCETVKNNIAGFPQAVSTRAYQTLNDYALLMSNFRYLSNRMYLRDSQLQDPNYRSNWYATLEGRVTRQACLQDPILSNSLVSYEKYIEKRAYFYYLSDLKPSFESNYNSLSDIIDVGVPKYTETLSRVSQLQSFNLSIVSDQQERIKNISFVSLSVAVFEGLYSSISTYRAYADDVLSSVTNTISELVSYTNNAQRASVSAQYMTDLIKDKRRQLEDDARAAAEAEAAAAKAAAEAAAKAAADAAQAEAERQAAYEQYLADQTLSNQVRYEYTQLMETKINTFLPLIEATVSSIQITSLSFNNLFNTINTQFSTLDSNYSFGMNEYTTIRATNYTSISMNLLANTISYTNASMQTVFTNIQSNVSLINTYTALIDNYSISYAIYSNSITDFFSSEITDISYSTIVELLSSYTDEINSNTLIGGEYIRSTDSTIQQCYSMLYNIQNTWNNCQLLYQSRKQQETISAEIEFAKQQRIFTISSKLEIVNEAIRQRVISRTLYSNIFMKYKPGGEYTLPFRPLLNTSGYRYISNAITNIDGMFEEFDYMIYNSIWIAQYNLSVLQSLSDVVDTYRRTICDTTQSIYDNLVNLSSSISQVYVVDVSDSITRARSISNLYPSISNTINKLNERYITMLSFVKVSPLYNVTLSSVTVSLNTSSIVYPPASNITTFINGNTYTIQNTYIRQPLVTFYETNVPLAIDVSATSAANTHFAITSTLSVAHYASDVYATICGYISNLYNQNVDFQQVRQSLGLSSNSISFTTYVNLFSNERAAVLSNLGLLDPYNTSNLIIVRNTISAYASSALAIYKSNVIQDVSPVIINAYSAKIAQSVKTARSTLSSAIGKINEAYSTFQEADELRKQLFAGPPVVYALQTYQQTFTSNTLSDAEIASYANKLKFVESYAQTIVSNANIYAIASVSCTRLNIPAYPGKSDDVYSTASGYSIYQQRTTAYSDSIKSYNSLETAKRAFYGIALNGYDIVKGEFVVFPFNPGNKCFSDPSLYAQYLSNTRNTSLLLQLAQDSSNRAYQYSLSVTLSDVLAKVNSAIQYVSDVLTIASVNTLTISQHLSSDQITLLSQTVSDAMVWRNRIRESLQVEFPTAVDLSEFQHAVGSPKERIYPWENAQNLSFGGFIQTISARYHSLTTLLSENLNTYTSITQFSDYYSNITLSTEFIKQITRNKYYTSILEGISNYKRTLSNASNFVSEQEDSVSRYQTIRSYWMSVSSPEVELNGIYSEQDFIVSVNPSISHFWGPARDISSDTLLYFTINSLVSSNIISNISLNANTYTGLKYFQQLFSLSDYVNLSYTTYLSSNNYTNASLEVIKSSIRDVQSLSWWRSFVDYIGISSFTTVSTVIYLSDELQSNYNLYDNNWLYYVGDRVSYNNKVYEVLRVDPLSNTYSVSGVPITNTDVWQRVPTTQLKRSFYNYPYVECSTGDVFWVDGLLRVCIREITAETVSMFRTSYIQDVNYYFATISYGDFETYGEYPLFNLSSTYTNNDYVIEFTYNSQIEKTIPLLYRPYPIEQRLVEYNIGTFTVSGAIDSNSLQIPILIGNTILSDNVPRFGRANHDPWGQCLFARNIRYAAASGPEKAYFRMRKLMVLDKSIADSNSSYNVSLLPIKAASWKSGWDALIARETATRSVFEPDGLYYTYPSNRYVHSSLVQVVDRIYYNLVKALTALRNLTVNTRTAVNVIKLQYFNIPAVNAHISNNPFDYINPIRDPRNPTFYYRDLGIGPLGLGTGEDAYYVRYKPVLEDLEDQIRYFTTFAKAMIGYDVLHFLDETGRFVGGGGFQVDDGYTPVPVPFTDLHIYYETMADITDKNYRDCSVFRFPSYIESANEMNSRPYDLIRSIEIESVRPPEYVTDPTFSAVFNAELQPPSEVTRVFGRIAKGLVGLMVAAWQQAADPFGLGPVSGFSWPQFSNTSAKYASFYAAAEAARLLYKIGPEYNALVEDYYTIKRLVGMTVTGRKLDEKWVKEYNQNKREILELKKTIKELNPKVDTDIVLPQEPPEINPTQFEKQTGAQELYKDLLAEQKRIANEILKYKTTLQGLDDTAGMIPSDITDKLPPGTTTTLTPVPILDEPITTKVSKKLYKVALYGQTVAGTSVTSPVQGNTFTDSNIYGQTIGKLLRDPGVSDTIKDKLKLGDTVLYSDEDVNEIKKLLIDKKYATPVLVNQAFQVSETREEEVVDPEKLRQRTRDLVTRAAIIEDNRMKVRKIFSDKMSEFVTALAVVTTNVTQAEVDAAVERAKNVELETASEEARRKRQEMLDKFNADREEYERKVKESEEAARELAEVHNELKGLYEEQAKLTKNKQYKEIEYTKQRIEDVTKTRLVTAKRRLDLTEIAIESAGIAMDVTGTAISVEVFDETFLNDLLNLTLNHTFNAIGSKLAYAISGRITNAYRRYAFQNASDRLVQAFTRFGASTAGRVGSGIISRLSTVAGPAGNLVGVVMGAVTMGAFSGDL